MQASTASCVHFSTGWTEPASTLRLRSSTALPCTVSAHDLVRSPQSQSYRIELGSAVYELAIDGSAGCGNQPVARGLDLSAYGIDDFSASSLQLNRHGDMLTSSRCDICRNGLRRRLSRARRRSIARRTPTPFDVPGETPIPGAVWLFGGGLGLVAMLGGRRKRKQKSVWEVTQNA